MKLWLKLHEPPCTDPYARWCGRAKAAKPSPIPIREYHFLRRNFRLPFRSNSYYVLHGVAPFFFVFRNFNPIGSRSNFSTKFSTHRWKKSLKLYDESNWPANIHNEIQNCPEIFFQHDYWMCSKCKFHELCWVSSGFSANFLNHRWPYHMPRLSWAKSTYYAGMVKGTSLSSNGVALRLHCNGDSIKPRALAENLLAIRH